MFSVLFSILVSNTPITGYMPFERTQMSSSNKAYRKLLTEEKNKVLKEAWDAAELGHYSIYYCLEGKDEQFANDLAKMLNKLGGLYATVKLHQLFYCITVDWNQV